MKNTLIAIVNTMKNTLIAIVLTISLFCSAVTVQANSNTNQISQVSTTSVVSPTTAQVIEKFGDKLDGYINVLASKVGVAADHFYPIFIRQQRIIGITDLLVIIGGVIGSLLLIRMGYHAFENKSDSDAGEFKKFFGLIVGIILSVVTLLCIFAVTDDIMGRIFNPEYYAVQSLVQMVK